MVIVHVGERTKLVLDGALIEVPHNRPRIWEVPGTPSDDFKEWMNGNFGYQAKSTETYTVHRMGWLIVPFLNQIRNHTPILVRHPEKIMLLKLTWF